MNDNSGNDEFISQFMAFTGSSDEAKAASYLEMSGNDVQTAVGLYMEHEQGSGGFGGFGGAGSTREDNNFSSSLGGNLDDDIRAPDATRRMRLMDDPMGVPADASYHMMNELMEEQFQSTFAAPVGRVDARAAVNAAIAAASSSRYNRRNEENKDNDENGYVYADDDDDDIVHYDDDDDDDEDMNSGAAPVPPVTLSDIFAAPQHLIHKAGGFQGARTMAKDTRRWLLVNLQKDAEFSSHALNRDVWRDELVENLIREGFIFWQQMDATTEGRTYCERYQVNEFPHIGIIDPRTGRLLLRKEGWTQQNPMTAESFAQMAMDFCSRNTFDRAPPAPRPAFAGGSGGDMGRSVKRPMHEMSEAEQFQAAMRASMEDVTTTPAHSESLDVVDLCSDDVDESKVPPPAVGTDSESTKEEETTTPSVHDTYLSITVPPEPQSGARIQFKMPDGKRVVRMFLASDPVSLIYAFLAQTSDEAKVGKEFVLLAGYPPKDLLPSIEDTIQDTNLSGQAITMRWK